MEANDNRWGYSEVMKVVWRILSFHKHLFFHSRVYIDINIKKIGVCWIYASLLHQLSNNRCHKWYVDCSKYGDRIKIKRSEFLSDWNKIFTKLIFILFCFQHCPLNQHKISFIKKSRWFLLKYKEQFRLWGQILQPI